MHLQNQAGNEPQISALLSSVGATQPFCGDTWSTAGIRSAIAARAYWPRQHNTRRELILVLAGQPTLVAAINLVLNLRAVRFNAPQAETNLSCLTCVMCVLHLMLPYTLQQPVCLPCGYRHVERSGNNNAWLIPCWVSFIAQLGLDNVLVQMEGEVTCRAFLDVLPDAGALPPVDLCSARQVSWQV